MGERDWGSLRNREWRPVSPAKEDGAGGGSSSSGASGGRGRGRGRGAAQSEAYPAASAARGNGRGGASAPAEAAGVSVFSLRPKAKEDDKKPRGDRFLTDQAITESRGGGRGGENRTLQKWQAVDDKGEALEQTLEELKAPRNGARARGGWDQFKVNEELFGVYSTFKEDLSQYTTPLNVKNVPHDVKQRAKMLAQEIEGRGGKKFNDMDTGAEYEWEEEGNEEDLFSAVGIRACQDEWPEESGGDGGIGGALLASLRAGSAAAATEASGQGGCDHRSLIPLKVQAWWRVRRQSGADVPAACEDALMCPFSQRVFGDVGMLMTHWASALPRDPDSKSEKPTPSSVATEEFLRAGSRLTFAEILVDTGLESLLPLTAPRAGSVWAQILTKLEVRGNASAKTGGENVPPPSRFVADFVKEAVAMKPWQRNQKVEHREVLESLAAGLALHLLRDTTGLAWTPLVQQEQSAAVAAAHSI